jgi:HlyD family secretion protein
MQIWAAVNEADVGRVKPGTPVTFTVDAFSDREFQGVVGKVRLNAAMTQNVVLYTVEINVDNPDKLLLPYLTASVRFILRRETNALVVPNAALRWSPSSLAEVAPDARNSNLIDPPGDTNSVNSSAQKNSAQNNSHRTLWLKAGDFVRPIEVTAGISDGANTIINSDGLHEGDEVVTGEILASQNDVKNPFLPKFIRR